MLIWCCCVVVWQTNGIHCVRINVDMQALAYDWNIFLLEDRQVFTQGQGDIDLQKKNNFLSVFLCLTNDHIWRKEHIVNKILSQCCILFVFMYFACFCVLFWVTSTVIFFMDKTETVLYITVSKF